MIRMLPQVSDSNARLAEGTMVAGLIDVRKTYATAAGTVEALAGVSVAFAPGSFTAVMGPSGSGTSTLLQCTAGLGKVTSGIEGAREGAPEDGHRAVQAGGGGRV